MNATIEYIEIKKKDLIYKRNKIIHSFLYYLFGYGEKKIKMIDKEIEYFRILECQEIKRLGKSYVKKRRLENYN